MMATANITRATRQDDIASERLFFLIMAIVIAVTVIFGFTVNAARMHWTFLSLPWHVHLHAVVFSSWIMLYVVQNWLIVRGSVRRHRQLGMIGAGIAAVMIVLGIVTTVMAEGPVVPAAATVPAAQPEKVGPPHEEVKPMPTGDK